MKKSVIYVVIVLLIASITIYSASQYYYKSDAPSPQSHLFTSRSSKSVDALWLARAIWSETKRPLEQRYIAWVIKNRVARGYRGKYTYREVVLDPYQFSAFNKNSVKRKELISKPASELKREIKIANQVMSNSSVRLLPKDVLHFWSPRSRDLGPPTWAVLNKEYKVKAIEGNRFKFYRGVR